MFVVIRDFFRVLNMPCKEHTVLLSRQLDAPLSPGEAIGLRVHIVYCRACRRFRTQIRRLKDLGTDVGTQLDKWELMPDAVRERLGNVIEEKSNGP